MGGRLENPFNAVVGGIASAVQKVTGQKALASPAAPLLRLNDRCCAIPVPSKKAIDYRRPSSGGVGHSASEESDQGFSDDDIAFGYAVVAKNDRWCTFGGGRTPR